MVSNLCGIAMHAFRYSSDFVVMESEIVFTAMCGEAREMHKDNLVLIWSGSKSGFPSLLHTSLYMHNHALLPLYVKQIVPFCTLSTALLCCQSGLIQHLKKHTKFIGIYVWISSTFHEKILFSLTTVIIALVLTSVYLQLVAHVTGPSVIAKTSNFSPKPH